MVDGVWYACKVVQRIIPYMKKKKPTAAQLVVVNKRIKKKKMSVVLWVSLVWESEDNLSSTLWHRIQRIVPEIIFLLTGDVSHASVIVTHYLSCSRSSVTAFPNYSVEDSSSSQRLATGLEMLQAQTLLVLQRWRWQRKERECFKTNALTRMCLFSIYQIQNWCQTW